MAGLLPSEGKLRGSPANILGRCARGRIRRAFLFFARGRTRQFSSAKFRACRIDKARDAEHRARDAHNAAGVKSPQSMRVCVMTGPLGAHDHSVRHRAPLIRRADAKIPHRAMRRPLLARVARIARAKNSIAHRRCPMCADDDHARSDHERDRLPRSARASRRRRRQTHRRIGNRVVGSSGRENRSFGPQPSLRPRIRDSRGNGSL